MYVCISSRLEEKGPDKKIADAMKRYFHSAN